MNTEEAVAAYLSEIKTIKMETLPSGVVKSLVYHPGEGKFSIKLDDRGGNVTDLWSGTESELATIYFDGYDGGPRNWNAVYFPRGTNWSHPDKTMEVFAVGETIKACVTAFSDSLGQSTLTDFVSHTNIENDYQWGAQFTIDGTSMKAAGVFVPGGAVMTWWK